MSRLVGESRSTRYHQMKQEIVTLRAALKLTDKFNDFDTWSSIGTQDYRDEIATRALLAEFGNPTSALVRLGFAVKVKDNVTDEQRFSLHKLVFDTPGVRARLARDLKDIDAARDQILGRQVQIALHGTDEAASRAAQVLAKVAGWQKMPDSYIDNRSVTMVNYLSEGKEKAAGELAPAQEDHTVSQLDYMPGEAVRIESDDQNVEAAMEAQLS